MVDDDMPVEVIDGPPTTVTPRPQWFRRRGTLVGIAVALAAVIAALVFTNGRADQKAVDAQGREFDCEGSAKRNIQPGGQFVDSLTCLNGGVPIQKIEVHDFFLSLGTDIILEP